MRCFSVRPLLCWVGKRICNVVFRMTIDFRLNENLLLEFIPFSVVVQQERSIRNSVYLERESIYTSTLHDQNRTKESTGSSLHVAVLREGVLAGNAKLHILRCILSVRGINQGGSMNVGPLGAADRSRCWIPQEALLQIFFLQAFSNTPDL